MRGEQRRWVRACHVCVACCGVHFEPTLRMREIVDSEHGHGDAIGRVFNQFTLQTVRNNMNGKNNNCFWVFWKIGNVWKKKKVVSSHTLFFSLRSSGVNLRASLRAWCAASRAAISRRTYFKSLTFFFFLVELQNKSNEKNHFCFLAQHKQKHTNAKNKQISTWASACVGSCTASAPRTFMKFEIFTRPFDASSSPSNTRSWRSCSRYNCRCESIDKPQWRSCGSPHLGAIALAHAFDLFFRQHHFHRRRRLGGEQRFHAHWMLDVVRDARLLTTMVTVLQAINTNRNDT